MGFIRNYRIHFVLEHVESVMALNTYNIPKGYLRISQVYEVNGYRDEVTIVRDNLIGRQVKRFYDFLDRHLDAVCRYDAESLDVKPGEVFPKWSLSYLWFQPVRFANRFFKRAGRSF